MTDTEIIEAYFRTRGWASIFGEDWDGKSSFENLPQILTDYPAFKEHVLEVMGEDDWELINGGMCSCWKDNTDQFRPYFEEEIVDNNILHAAVIAATRYFEGKK